MLAIDPSVRHVVNILPASKGMGRNFGVPEEWMASEEQYSAKVQAEQEAIRQQQGAENAANLINAGSKLKPEQVQGVMKAMGGKAA